jgi:hypothetical protein
MNALTRHTLDVNDAVVVAMEQLAAVVGNEEPVIIHTAAECQADEKRGD